MLITVVLAIIAGLMSVQGFKNEIKALCAYFTLLNPSMLHMIFNCCWMDTSDTAFKAPTLDEFGVVAVSLPFHFETGGLLEWFM